MLLILQPTRWTKTFVEKALAESAVAEEADGNLSGAESLRGECSACRNAGASADDRIRTEIAGAGSAMCIDPPLPLQ
jgi:hypothetical protein